DTYVAQDAIPRLTIRLGGILQNTAPNPSTAPPCLVLKVNNVIRILVTIPKSVVHCGVSNNTNIDATAIINPSPEIITDSDAELNDKEEADLR
ncbi:hypothetical protein H0H92_012463, partial [Tricholoma furcatifolium]